MMINLGSLRTVISCRRVYITALLILLLGLVKPADGQDVPPVNFSKHVAPILQQRCLNCHGASQDKGGLQLHNATVTARGGDSGKVVVAGNSGESELLRRLKTGDVQERMPLKLTPLSVKEIQLITSWIDQGAKWPDQYTITPYEQERAQQAVNHWD